MQSNNDDKSSSSNPQYINMVFMIILEWYIHVPLLKVLNAGVCGKLRNNSLIIRQLFFGLFDEVGYYIVIIRNSI